MRKPMLAVAAPMPAHPERYAFEHKWDGMRAIVAVAVREGEARGRRPRTMGAGGGAGGLSIRSRNDLEQAHRFPELAPLARALEPETVLDGEIVCLNPDGRPDFGRLQSRFGLDDESEIRAQVRSNPVHFLAFDVLRLAGKDVTGKPFAERRRLLEGLRFQGDSWGTTPSLVGSGEDLLQASRELGMEGIVAKRLDSPYVAGRSDAWLKIRTRNRQEFVVGGWTKGVPGRALGALVVGCYEGRRLVSMGRVGSGFTDRDIEALRPQLARLARKDSPFSGGEAAADLHFVEPRIVVEVEFNGLTRNGSLRQASFKGVREDKPARKVVWEQVEPRESVAAEG